jgi:hypothetical protein
MPLKEFSSLEERTSEKQAIDTSYPRRAKI